MRSLRLRTTLFYIVIPMAATKGLYKDFYAGCGHPVLYAAPWWLDAVCGKENWDAVPLKDEEGLIKAWIPFYKTRISRLSALITPPLTQWIPLLSKESTNHLSIDTFLASLPQCSILDLSMKPGENSTLPSSGYQVNFKYSYVIPYSTTEGQFKLKYNEGLRRNLKEAAQEYIIDISNDLHTFLSLCKSSYHHRKLTPPIWLEQIVPGVAETLKKNGAGHIHMAFHHGVVLAGILTGWDAGTTYYLAGGRSGDERGASAHALLLDHAIHAAQERGQSFDFEGSMHPGIANFFQSFGGMPDSYLQIRKFRGPGRIWSLFH